MNGISRQAHLAKTWSCSATRPPQPYILRHRDRREPHWQLRHDFGRNGAYFLVLGCGGDTIMGAISPPDAHNEWPLWVRNGHSVRVGLMSALRQKRTLVTASGYSWL